MQERLNETLEEMKKKLAELDKGDALKDVRTQYLGKKGKISAMMKQMGQLAPEERPRLRTEGERSPSRGGGADRKKESRV